MDDESDVCFVLGEVLCENGFVVDSYENPMLALEKFKSHSYDLVLLDIKMPGLNGFVLYREIKRLDRKVKVCFLTAGELYYGLYSDIFSSIPSNCFIRKPIDNEGLLNRIKEILTKGSKERALKEQGREWLVASYTPEEFGVTNPGDIKWMNPRLSPMPWHTHAQTLRITNPKA